MAGDVGVDECILILGLEATYIHSRDVVQIVHRSGGRVIHVYGQRVFIVSLLPGTESGITRQLESAEIGWHSSMLSGEIRAELDPVGALGLAAFDLRQSQEYYEEKANRPRDGEDWDTRGVPSLGLKAQPPIEPAIVPARQRLHRNSAVGLVIVSGPGNLEFAVTEVIKVIAEVQNALTWLQSQTPEALTWYYDIHSITIDVPPNPSAPDKEALWRDPAMTQLGFNGPAVVTQYRDRLRANFRTTTAFPAYFTKYPLDHFAYMGGTTPHVVMDYANDGYRPEEIDRVFAHETCHVYNAPNEYASDCSDCGGQIGYYGVPNGNCRTCASPGVNCIMDKNDWAMCKYTPWQLGFPWPQGKPINSTAQTQRTPTLCKFKSDLYLFWDVLHEDILGVSQMMYSKSSDGVSWREGQLINQRGSYGGPPVVVFQNKLHLTYGIAHSILMMVSDDGEVWTQPKYAPVFSAIPHTSCVYNNLLYVFYKASTWKNGMEQPLGPIGYLVYDGVKWLDPIKPFPDSVITGAPPVVCVFKDKLYVFWNDPVQNTIQYSTSTDALNWSAAKVINVATSTVRGLRPAFLMVNWPCSGRISGRVIHSIFRLELCLPSQAMESPGRQQNQ